MTRAPQTTGIQIPSSEAREAALGFENVDFFSDYFLRHGLWSTPDLIAKLNMAGADEAWHTLHRAYNTGTFGLDEFANPEETYSRWIRPLLRALGYESGKGAEIETERGLLAVSHTHTFGPAPAAGEADTRPRVLFQTEAWGTDLDAARDGKTGRTTPTSQAFACLRHADSRARWALVTNGQEVRLIGSDLSLPPRAHLTFDLNRIFHRGNNRDASYLLFWALTNEKATHPGEDGKCLLDSILEESRRLAQSVRGALGDVIPQLLETLVRDLRRNNPEFREQADADEAHRTGVILLYRLLFIAYAEAKGLLPISNQLYRDAYSFETLRTRVEDKARRNEPWPPGRRTLWPQLTALFRFLSEDLSTPDLPLMPLGGRLFDPEATPWLASATLPDSDTARLIEGLSLAEVKRGRSKRAQSRERINYADLDISELGSIYEKLLKFLPAIASDEMRVVQSGQDEVVVSASLPVSEGELEIGIVPAGEFYLATSEGRRKATGTVYTPRMVTEFQARHSLEPHCRLLAEQGDAEAILRLKILDPAMGSGAFLVATVHELASWLEKACVTAGRPDNYRAAQARLSELNTPTSGVILAIIERSRSAFLDDDDHAELRRLAAESCIYGMDVSPLATELAKVSLWLSTVARERPLTFLDDRLVVGNSLFGPRAADLRDIPEEVLHESTSGREENIKRRAIGAMRDEKQASLRDTWIGDSMRALAEARMSIASVPTRTVADALWKAKALAAAKSDSTSRHQAMLDVSRLWTLLQLPEARTVLSRIPRHDEWRELIDALRSGASLDQWRDLLDEAHRFGHAKHLTLWEYEFPEAFQGGGFDVVIGNPPYVRVQQLAHEEVDFYKKFYAAATLRFDLSLLFFERGASLLQQDGTLSFISSSQFMKSDYGQGLRKWLSEQTETAIIDFGDAPIFEEVQTYVAIFFIQRKRDLPVVRYREMDLSELKRLAFSPIPWTGPSWRKLQPTDDPSDAWVFVDPIAEGIIAKVKARSLPLDEVADTAYGILTGNDSVLIADADSGFEDNAIRPLLFAEDVTRWRITAPSRRVIYPYVGRAGKTILRTLEDLETHAPNVAAYLGRHRATLTRRKDSREEIGERGEWHGLVRASNIDVIDSRKIVSPGVARKPRFALEEGGHAFIGKGVTGIVPQKVDPEILLGLLNSKLSEWWMNQTSPLKAGGYRTYSSTFVGGLPVHIAAKNDGKPASQRTLVIERAAPTPSDDRDRKIIEELREVVGRLLSRQGEGATAEAEIDELVFALYDFSEEERIAISASAHKETDA